MAAIHEGKRAKQRRVLEEIAEAFRDDFPKLYADQLQLIEDANKALITPSGMSTGGQFMTECKFLPEIYVFVQRQLGHDFWRDPDNVDLVRRVWGKFTIQKEAKPYFKGGIARENADE
jgi:hypothetical protein